ncbi:hypothetical protein TELCIR_07905, partial [Teladorsagia circumcincta]
MVAKDALYTQTLGSLLVSFYDILMMNELYNCTGRCKKEDSKKCRNHGFAHPRDCSKCICPSGYGGDFCDKRPDICGQELNATRNWTRLITANSSNMTAGDEDGYKKCVYWLLRHINLSITSAAVIDNGGRIYGKKKEVPRTFEKGNGNFQANINK